LEPVELFAEPDEMLAKLEETNEANLEDSIPDPRTAMFDFEKLCLPKETASE